MNEAAIDQIASRVTEELERGARVPISALILLVRRYAATGNPAIGAVLAPALTATLDESDEDRAAVAGRVVLLTEASAILDDDRLSPGMRRLVHALESGWPDRGPFVRAVASVEALLLASPLLENTGGIARAIDELERLMASSYEPGEGLARTPPSQAPGTATDHVAAASTLLTAYAITGRLPYAMLAEELIRVVRPGLVSSTPRSDAGTSDNHAFHTACEAARVFCRLAALHADSEYRSAAVLAADAHYGDDAERLLRSLGSEAFDRGAHGAAYTLALGEWLARTV